MLMSRVVVVVAAVVVLGAWAEASEFVGERPVSHGGDCWTETLLEVADNRNFSTESELGAGAERQKTAASKSGTITWSYEDWHGSYGGIARCMAMPGDGSRIYVAWDLNYERISAFDAEGDGSTLWEYDLKEGSTYYIDESVFVRVSDDGNLLVASAADRTPVGEPTYDSVLYRLDPATGSEVWTPVIMPPTQHDPDNMTEEITHLEVAADGSMIVVATKGYRSSPVFEPFYLHLYSPDGAPLHTFEIPDPSWDILCLNDVKVNDDGSRMVADFRMYDDPKHMVKVWDLDTLSEIQTFNYSNSAPQCRIGLSGDGGILGIGNLRGVLGVFSFNSDLDEYQELWSYTIPPDYYYPWIEAIAISKDGSTLAMGSYQPNQADYHGYLYAFDVAAGPPFIYQSADFGDRVLDVAVSDTGEIVVGAGYGPLDNPATGWDLIAYSTYLDEDVYQMEGTYPGSLYACEIDSSGIRVGAGGKRVHARESGSGGWAYSVELEYSDPDLIFSDGFESGDTMGWSSSTGR